MGKYAQVVMGPAGSGKSSYCTTMQQHCENIKRSVHVVNLDPAAEDFQYEPSIDVKNLITVDDVMEEMSFGPNGGLVFCMEYLTKHLSWLKEELGEYEDDYLIVDCPGQIELYTHIPIMKQITDALQQWGYRVAIVYLIDAQFMNEPSKFLSGALMCLSAMVQFELPHINVLTKLDLLGNKAEGEEMEKYFDVDCREILADAQATTPTKYTELTDAIARVIDDYNMVGFMPLNVNDEDSIGHILINIDNAIQFGEDEEPKMGEDVLDGADEDGDGDD